MLCQLRIPSPSGAHDCVSRPNQLTPVRRTSRPSGSTSLEPAAFRGPGDPPAAPSPPCDGPASPGTEPQATMPTNRGVKPSRSCDQDGPRHRHPVLRTRVNPFPPRPVHIGVGNDPDQSAVLALQGRYGNGLI